MGQNQPNHVKNVDQRWNLKMDVLFVRTVDLVNVDDFKFKNIIFNLEGLI